MSSLQTYVISYPKSGRTWLRALIGKTICENYKLDDRFIFKTKYLTKSFLPFTIQFSHDDSQLTKGIHYPKMVYHKAKYMDSNVIFLIRDVRDVLVSSYFQATKRAKVFTGSINEFVRSSQYGADKVLKFYENWYQNQHLAKNFLLISYEELHQEPLKTLQKVFTFLDVPFDEQILQQAIAFSSFTNLKKLEFLHFFSEPILKPADIKDPESFKMREGKIGNYKKYLDKEDIIHIDTRIHEANIPWRLQW